MLALLSPLRKRWPKLDAACRAIETYTSLFEQWGWLGVSAAVGGVAAMTTFLAESWLPLAVVTGLSTMALLYAVPAIFRLRSLQPGGTGEENSSRNLARQITDHQALLKKIGSGQEINHALFYLLDQYIVDMVERLIDDCIAAQPNIPKGDTDSWSHTYLREWTDKSDRYVDYVRGTLSGTGWVNHTFQHMIHSAEIDAEREVREAIEALPSGVNPFDAKNYVRARLQCERIGVYLRDVKERQFKTALRANIDRFRPLRDIFDERFTSR